ncbi:MAG: acyl carrier protein [Nitrospira sp.]|nr:acyl carrier protein [Nitrospira sp.]MDH4368759.1 acyl carrier protein [Nitrospira sp.]MDH5346891.1 acyl carrier protein [Nitrospira sp.]MDH5498062.1 acyl carrier protein [Nitrospira sp.]MDH5726306.1 acyl carrier protein [Nitrospira sp.]
MTERIDPQITEKIVHALASYLKRDPASITEAHHLRDDLGLDSVAVIELLFEIEERFKLQIPDQDLPGLSTVGSVAAYVQRRLAELQGDSKPESPKPKTASTKSGSKKSASSRSTSAKSSSVKSASTKLKPVSAKQPKTRPKPAAKTKKKVAAR